MAILLDGECLRLEPTLPVVCQCGCGWSGLLADTGVEVGEIARCPQCRAPAKLIGELQPLPQPDAIIEARS